MFEAEKAAQAMLREAAEKATEINRETDLIKKETPYFPSTSSNLNTNTIRHD